MSNLSQPAGGNAVQLFSIIISFYRNTNIRDCRLLWKQQKAFNHSNVVTPSEITLFWLYFERQEQKPLFMHTEMSESSFQGSALALTLLKVSSYALCFCKQQQNKRHTNHHLRVLVLFKQLLLGRPSGFYRELNLSHISAQTQRSESERLPLLIYNWTSRNPTERNPVRTCLRICLI